MKPTQMRWRKLLNKWWQGQPLERTIASKSKMSAMSATSATSNAAKSNATTNSATSSATNGNETTAKITTTITLNCVVFGEDPSEQAFPITLPGESTVAEL